MLQTSNSIEKLEQNEVEQVEQNQVVAEVKKVPLRLPTRGRTNPLRTGGNGAEANSGPLCETIFGDPLRCQNNQRWTVPRAVTISRSYCPAIALHCSPSWWPLSRRLPMIWRKPIMQRRGSHEVALCPIRSLFERLAIA